jgi:hypothetical protein
MESNDRKGCSASAASPCRSDVRPAPGLRINPLAMTACKRPLSVLALERLLAQACSPRSRS